MRKAIYALLLVSLFFIPLQRVEIANLEPVQAVWLHQEDGSIVLKTDTGDEGSGATIVEALADMKENSSGIIYLDTAEFLFVSASAKQQVSTLQPYLKGNMCLCQWDGHGSIDEAVKYAKSHKIGIKMRKWSTGSNLPILPPLKQDK